MSRLFRVFIPVSVLGLISSELLLIFGAYIAGCALITPLINPEFDLMPFLTVEDGLIRIAVVALCIVIGLYFQNLYSEFRVKSVTVLIQQLCLVAGFAFLIQALFSYVKKPEWSLPRWGMIFGSAIALIVIPAWRVFYSGVVLRALTFRRVLFLGSSPVIQEIAKHLSEHPELGIRVLGYVDSHPDLHSNGQTLPGGSVLGPVEDLKRIGDSLRPDLVVVGMTERRQELPLTDMLRMRFSGIQFEDCAVTFEATFGRVPTRQLRPSRLIFSADLGPRKGSLFWHSMYSLPIALVLFVVSAPVMLIVAVCVKLTSRGPVFYRQVRVGLNDRPFTLYKFRSMYAGAEARTGAVWARKHDSRITPVGKWLRRLRFDELPQLFNVLKGDMSLVGPRPERPEFVSLLTEQIPYYSYRHCVKPGITGWAQINYRYGETVEDAIMKLEFDLYYIKNLAVSLDMFIVFHTLKVMLFSETAN